MFNKAEGTEEEQRETSSRRRRGRRGSGRAATTAARAPGRSRRSASAWTPCAAGATRRAGTASSPPSASTRPSTSAWTASQTSASGGATPSPPADPVDRLTGTRPPTAIGDETNLPAAGPARQFSVSRGFCFFLFTDPVTYSSVRVWFLSLFFFPV